MSIQCNGASRRFAKETRTLKMGSIVSVHRRLTMSNWKQSLKLTLLQPQEKLLKNSTLTILCLFDICSKLERWAHELTANQKQSLIWSVNLSYSMQQQQTISGLDGDIRWKVDFIWQSAMTNSVARWRGSSKALPKAKLVPKKVHGHCLVVCCPSDSL